MKGKIIDFLILHEGLIATLDDELIEEDYDDIQDKFVAKVKDFMVSKILSLKEIEDKLTLKREWSKKNKGGFSIPFEFDVQQWSTFLPPLTPVTVTRLNNIGQTNVF